MTLRRRIFSRQSIFAIVNYARFIPKLQRHFHNAEVLRDDADCPSSPDSQNLRYVTRAWIKRLKEANVPEAEHSVKIITEHIVGKERLLVGMPWPLRFLQTSLSLTFFLTDDLCKAM